MKLLITRADNGFILECDESIEVVEDEVIDAETARTLALTIWEHFGLSGNRHDDLRPYVVLAPGDKREPLPVCPFCSISRA